MAEVLRREWAINDAACPAAQMEWDRFMGQTRKHEQEAHIDAILHPDNGHCGEEEESSMMGSFREWLAHLGGGSSETA